ncbi:MAG: hypothetical protein EZS28_012422 [Streblomastix strix]|uniref:HYDIN/VesB/CFA65-like Ig-like domain-containing protein n=1 Tax=Streblomastix strix TaxID=222440 RepID=A0A5J4WB69_9EUKA|nr:MAG: hypothetical protein EZS28_012422 [Streblomastix strix]
MLKFHNQFSVQHDRPVKIPEGESQDCTVTFTRLADETAMTAAEVQPIDGVGGSGCGLIETFLPIRIRRGPIVLVSHQATLCLPDVELSTEKIDFGTIKLGQCAQQTIRLTNTLTVAATWGIKNSTDGQNTGAQLRFEPAKGVISGGDFCDVVITFAHQQKVVKHYNVRISLKVNASYETHYIQIKGSVDDWDVVIAPEVINFPTTMPFTNGIQCRLVMRNYSQFPVEICCPEFDRQSLYEEAVLRQIPHFGKDGSALIPVRKAGEPLSRELIEEFERKHIQERKMKPKPVSAQPPNQIVYVGQQSDELRKKLTTSSSITRVDDLQNISSSYYSIWKKQIKFKDQSTSKRFDIRRERIKKRDQKRRKRQSKPKQRTLPDLPDALLPPVDKEAEQAAIEAAKPQKEAKKGVIGTQQQGAVRKEGLALKKGQQQQAGVGKDQQKDQILSKDSKDGQQALKDQSSEQTDLSEEQKTPPPQYAQPTLPSKFQSNYIVSALPLSGKTTTAQALAEHANFPIITLDSLLQWAVRVVDASSTTAMKAAIHASGGDELADDDSEQIKRYGDEGFLSDCKKLRIKDILCELYSTANTFSQSQRTPSVSSQGIPQRSSQHIPIHFATEAPPDIPNIEELKDQVSKLEQQGIYRNSQASPSGDPNGRNKNSLLKPKAVPGGKPQTPSPNQPVVQNPPVTVSTGKKLTDKEKAQQADANAAVQAAAVAFKEQQEREEKEQQAEKKRRRWDFDIYQGFSDQIMTLGILTDEQINVIERRKDYARQRRILDTCVVVRDELLRIADEYDFICKQREENRRKRVNEMRRKQKERKAEELKKKIEEKSKREQDELEKIMADAMQKEQEAAAGALSGKASKGGKSTVGQTGKSGASGQGDASKDDKSGQKGGAGKQTGAKGSGKTGVDSILGDSDDKDIDGQNDEYDDLVLQAQEDEIVFEKGVKNLYFRETVLLDLFKVHIPC